jgi:hypothetical protein
MKLEIILLLRCFLGYSLLLAVGVEGPFCIFMLLSVIDESLPWPRYWCVEAEVERTLGILV